MINPPPPTPCIALAAINIPILTAAPHSALPTKNIIAAPSRIGFRPQISLNFPQLGVATATANKYDDPIHVYPELELKCCAIVGRAVVMMLMSNVAKNTDAHNEDIITNVWNVVRDASGSSGVGAATPAVVAPSFSILDVEPL